ncbi:outer membrane lipoprotein carrier protein LolA [Clostridiisalibacter paucivorans]|uniref:outer membrane lipoprotein carrier protein LolA n=1 Tax=Clostridiisalibacter paucivorans TaxID=408753 RepID=UPI00047E20DB|nr:outer membrane lipoprotein carrier protein LolA [Clostridiisalibacter paucivorans]
MNRLLVGLLIFTLLLIGCTEPTNDEVSYELQKKLNNMQSYSCVGDIHTLSNKDKRVYRVKEFYENPNKYIIEFVNKNDKIEQKIVNDGENAWIHNPQIKNDFLIKNIEQIEEYNTYMGKFLEDFITGEDSQINCKNIDDIEYFVLTTSVGGSNKYRDYAELWINKKNFSPLKMIILDKNDKITVEVYYEDFIYNPDIEIDNLK